MFMSANSIHKWYFETYDSKSQWIFVNPSEFARSLGLYVLELGHFFQSGHCTSIRQPEDSFCLSFLAPDGPEPTHLAYHYQNESYCFSGDLHDRVALMDNREGYTQEQYGTCENYFIQFSGPLAAQFHELFHAKCAQFDLKINWLQSMIDAYEELVRVYRQPASEMGDLYAFSLLVRILTQLTLDADQTPVLFGSNPYVEFALDQIEKRYAEPLKLKDNSDALHINSSYLSRLFSRYVGSSFSDCLIHVRINHAKELLTFSNLSVEEISVRCGLCNASHFIRLFRQREGLTPSRFRTLRNEFRRMS